MYVQQNEFCTDIEEMEKEELNKCLRKFYVAAGKQDGSHYNKAILGSIRAAIDNDTCATNQTLTTSHSL